MKKNYKLGVLLGDGIGEEIVKATVSLLEETNKHKELVNFEFVELPMGETAIKSYGNPMPKETKEALEKLDGWIMGPHDSVAYPKEFLEERNPSGELRHHFDLFANIRPTISLPNVQGVVKNADLVIYRENTEGFYVDRNMFAGVGEWKITPDVAVATGVFTRKAIERIAKAAFEAAMTRRKKITIVHKANVIRYGTGMFKDICYEIAEDYPEVMVDDYHIDAMAAHLVRHIDNFDVIVTENMFGDILSDLTGELSGSLGLSPSINTNNQYVMAQAAHGSAPDIANQNLANPVGIMLSTVMMLEWLSFKNNDKGLLQLSNAIREGIYEAMKKGKTTKDLGGNETTTSFTEVVIAEVN